MTEKYSLTTNWPHPGLLPHYSLRDDPKVQRKIACVAGVERFRGWGGREKGRAFLPSLFAPATQAKRKIYCCEKSVKETPRRYFEHTPSPFLYFIPKIIRDPALAKQAVNFLSL